MISHREYPANPFSIEAENVPENFMPEEWPREGVECRQK